MGLIFWKLSMWCWSNRCWIQQLKHKQLAEYTGSDRSIKHLCIALSYVVSLDCLHALILNNKKHPNCPISGPCGFMLRNIISCPNFARPLPYNPNIILLQLYLIKRLKLHRHALQYFCTWWKGILIHLAVQSSVCLICGAFGLHRFLL